MSVDLNTNVAGRGGSTFGAEGSILVLRCACGATIEAESEKDLISVARHHLGKFHPDLSDDVPSAAILAMAEQKEEPRGE
jgi:hypothetical protein